MLFRSAWRQSAFWRRTPAQHRGLDHLGDVVVLGVQLFDLGCCRGPPLRQPAFGAGHDYPGNRADTDQENDRQNAAGHLCAIGADEPLGNGGHDERTAGGTGLYQTGDLKIKKMTDISQIQAGFKAKIPLCL